MITQICAHYKCNSHGATHDVHIQLVEHNLGIRFGAIVLITVAHFNGRHVVISVCVCDCGVYSLSSKLISLVLVLALADVANVLWDDRKRICVYLIG